MKKNLLVLLALIICIASSKAQLTESFDGTTFPPTGWVNTHSVGTDGSAVWARETAGAFGGDNTANTTTDFFYVDPHSGAGMAVFSSYDFAPGNGATLITKSANLSSGAPHIISFWMYRDDLYTTRDSISVYVNTTQSSTGATFLGTVLRNRQLSPVENGPNDWYEYNFDIPPSFSGSSNYFIFKAVGAYGNNMFIDDISVMSRPSCGRPTAIRATSYNYAANTINIGWTVPALGTPGAYEWAIGTTNTPPSSGTSVSATAAAIGGVTPGVLNYIFVRSDCGGVYSAWSSYAFAALPCATLTAPANAAANVPQSQSFSWASIAGANSYNFYLGSSSGAEANLGNTTLTSVPISNLLSMQTYYWYVVPLIKGVAAPRTSCTEFSFTTAAESSTLVNNPCSGAITITSANIAGNGVVSTTLNATISLPSSLCNGFTNSPDDDVWFEFTTSSLAPTGTLSITPNTTNGITDVVAQVYQATSCSNLGTPVTCADNNSDDSTEVINLSMLSPNTHYYMRVFSYTGDPADEGGFTITASAGNTLPIRLESFTARRANGVNILNWTTQQEINTSHFIIERSSDGNNFTKIGQVTAAGNSNTPRNYAYTDQHPGRGNNYYRLRTIDKDNAAKVSDIKRIRNEGIADISLYPNPVTSKLSVAINADKNVNGQMIITDLSGKTIYNRSLKLPEGDSLIPVSLENISSGTYIIKIQLGDDLIVKKFTKQ